MHMWPSLLVGLTLIAGAHVAKPVVGLTLIAGAHVAKPVVGLTLTPLLIMHQFSLLY